MIAGIECGLQTVGMIRIARDLIEVDHRVEVAGSSNPFVHGLPVGLTGRSGVIVARTGKRQQRRTDHFDAMRVSASDDLLVGADHPPNQGLVFGALDIAIVRKHANVVDAFENDEIAHPRLRNDVMIKTRQSVRAQSVAQQTVAADSLIENSYVA